MVVIGNQLLIHGGLLSQQDQPGLEGACPSSGITLIDLATPTTTCNGRSALTLNGMCNTEDVDVCVHVHVH